MIVGNLNIEKRKSGTYQLTLNTYHAGVPSCIFTKHELGVLIGVLKDLAGAEAPKPPKKKITVVATEDDFDISDFV